MQKQRRGNGEIKTDVLGSFIAAFSEMKSSPCPRTWKKCYSTSNEVNGNFEIYFICRRIKFTVSVPSCNSRW